MQWEGEVARGSGEGGGWEAAGGPVRVGFCAIFNSIVNDINL